MLLAVLAVAGCGVDGPPKPPQAGAAPGISLSGQARVGITSGG